MKAKITDLKITSDQLVIKIINVEQKKSKILVPEGTKDKEMFQEHPFQGEVLAYGPGFKNEGRTIDAEIGDIVYLDGPPRPDRGIVITDENDKPDVFPIIREANVIAVLKQNK